MISDSKYVGDVKQEPIEIRSVGANNCDAVIIENGVYEAEPPFTGFGKVTVMVEQSPSGSLVGWIPKNITDGVVSCSEDFIDFTGITEIGGDYCYSYIYYSNPVLTEANFKNVSVISGTSSCANMFYNCQTLTVINLSSLVSITGTNSCANMFSSCKNLENVYIGSLEFVSGNSCCNSMFSNCENLSYINIGNLKEITGNNGCAFMFYKCKKIEGVNIDSLTTISSYNGGNMMFRECNNLESVNFKSLSSLTGSFACDSMFRDSIGLKTLFFPALNVDSFGELTNQFRNMLQGVTGCTIHFPSALNPQSGSTVISSLNGYPNFGGTNTVVLFDLPETE